jgi:hypothetical protein
MRIVGLKAVLVPGCKGLSQEYAVSGAGNERYLVVNCIQRTADSMRRS